MAATLRTAQSQQIISFWNLIQAADENVQQGLFALLRNKFAVETASAPATDSKFFSLKGSLKFQGSHEMDKELLEEYMEEKYGK